MAASLLPGGGGGPQCFAIFRDLSAIAFACPPCGLVGALCVPSAQVLLLEASGSLVTAICPQFSAALRNFLQLDLMLPHHNPPPPPLLPPLTRQAAASQFRGESEYYATAAQKAETEAQMLSKALSHAQDPGQVDYLTQALAKAQAEAQKYSLAYVDAAGRAEQCLQAHRDAQARVACLQDALAARELIGAAPAAPPLPPVADARAGPSAALDAPLERRASLLVAETQRAPGERPPSAASLDALPDVRPLSGAPFEPLPAADPARQSVSASRAQSMAPFEGPIASSPPSTADLRRQPVGTSDAQGPGQSVFGFSGESVAAVHGTVQNGVLQRGCVRACVRTAREMVRLMPSPHPGRRMCRRSA